MNVHLATLETTNFTFQAIGATEVEAVEAIRKGWNKHARRTGAVIRFDDLRDDVNVIVMQSGRAYRDGMAL